MSDSTPEYLDSSGGAPLPPTPTDGGGGGRRRGLVVGGGVLGLAVVGVGAWAAYGFLATGSQPAEALPADTLGYVSIDLDPSGGQKIEALRTLNKFPAFKDEVGITGDGDLRKQIFGKILAQSPCQGLTYDDDIAPWLGDRAAVAAVDLAGDEPVPVLVVQVTDSAAADKGLAGLEACGSSDDSNEVDSTAWVIDGDWAVVAETEKQAQQVVDAAADASLADDEDFKRWTTEAGDPGVMTMYAGPSAGDYLADHTDALGGASMFGMGGTASYSCSDDGKCFEGDAVVLPDSSDAIGPMTDKLRGFQGLAATVRFSDGAIELETAGDGKVTGKGLLSGGGAGDVVGSLPADTVAALGVDFSDGWFSAVADQLATYAGQSSDELMSMLSKQTGLDLPADAEALAGDSMAISLGAGFDVQKLGELPVGKTPDMSGIPVALKIKGDPATITGALDKLTSQLGPLADVVGTSEGDDAVVVGPDAGYRDAVAEDGGLGDDPVYQAVVRDADDASSVLFVNVDNVEQLIGDTFLGKDDQEALANLKPVSGFGITGWLDGDVAHAVMRLTTD